MFSRYFLALSAVVLAVALFSESVQCQEKEPNVETNTDVTSDDVQRGGGISDYIYELFHKGYKNLTDVCAKRVAKKCKWYWYDSNKLQKCAKDYFNEPENLKCLLGL